MNEAASYARSRVEPRLIESRPYVTTDCGRIGFFVSRLFSS